MQRMLMVSGVLGCLVLSAPMSARAQFGDPEIRYGMFGPRVLGRPLQPRQPSRFGGLEHGPSGNFEGLRDRYSVFRAAGVDLAAPEAIPTRPNLERIRPAVEQPAAPSPPQTPTPPTAAPLEELPLRRTTPSGLTEPSPPASPPQQTPLQGQAGPGVLSPFQTPGAPAVEFRAGFDVQPLASQRAATRLTRQLTESPRLQRLSPIAVQVEGQTAILRGSVASAYDRRLAEQVVRMQPGIWNVKNELTVGSPP